MVFSQESLPQVLNSCLATRTLRPLWNDSRQKECRQRGWQQRDCRLRGWRLPRILWFGYRCRVCQVLQQLLPRPPQHRQQQHRPRLRHRLTPTPMPTLTLIFTYINRTEYHQDRRHHYIHSCHRISYHLVSVTLYYYAVKNNAKFSCHFQMFFNRITWPVNWYTKYTHNALQTSSTSSCKEYRMTTYCAQNMIGSRR